MSTYINRSIESVLLKTSKTFPVVMITGPRQVGKTTLLNFISKNSNKKINYVSLDDLKVRTLAIEDPELFLETYEIPLIIDEFQYAPNLLSYIKIIVDKKRLDNFDNNTKKTGLYYLTGSQVFHAIKDVSDSLAGRAGILDLYGLSTREINHEETNLFIPELSNLKKQHINNMTLNKLFERIIKGSYPELYSNKSMDRNLYFETYVRTYIERDIRDLINVKDEIKFMKFISSIAARTGCELNINDICNDIEISNPTAQAWLSILCNTNLVYLLQPYSNNNVSRIVKRPKLYFLDTGLACYLTGYTDSVTLEKSAYNGQIFETYVISEIIKSFANEGLSPKRYLYYYRDNNGKEIDLLINYNNKIYPIEIKKSKNLGKDCIKNFDVVERFNIEKSNGIVLCMVDQLFPIDNDNYLVPIEYI